MNIAVAYLYGENYSELASITKPSLIAYCAKHNYACHIKCVDKNSKGWYGFINTKYGRELLDKYDLVFVMEGDFLITNLSPKIEDFIDEENHFYICKDRNNYNGGSWICKGTKEGKAWLDFVNSFENEVDHEQYVFEKYCSLTPFIKTLFHPSINSIPYSPYYGPSYGKMLFKEGDETNIPTLEEGHWTPNCLNCHLPGLTDINQRIKIFTELKESIIYE